VKLSRRTVLTAVLSTCALGAIIAGVVVVSSTGAGSDAVPEARPTTQSASPSPVATSATPAPPYVEVTADAIAALPEANYSAVIPGLLPYEADDVPEAMSAVYRIASDQPLFDAARKTPVARIAAQNFLMEDSVLVPVAFDGDWALVLTPSRQSLPSKDDAAPAQTAAWIPAASLEKVQDLRSHVVVSVGDETVSIIDGEGNVGQSFSAGVGAADTPTPVGSLGYLQARYLDPAQNQEVYPIALTSLHSDAADEPYGGSDGGLIGMHYETDRSGAISHGCIRLSGEAITALNALPLGTPIILQA
jgi:hypothetical protein